MATAAVAAFLRVGAVAVASAPLPERSWLHRGALAGLGLVWQGRMGVTIQHPPLAALPAPGVPGCCRDPHVPGACGHVPVWGFPGSCQELPGQGKLRVLPQGPGVRETTMAHRLAPGLPAVPAESLPCAGSRQAEPQPSGQHFCAPRQSLSSKQGKEQGAMSRSGAAAGQAPGFSAAPRGREVRLHCSVLVQHRETCPCQTPLPPPGWTPSCVPSQSLPHIPAAVRRLLAARRELRHSNGDCTGNGTGRRVPAAPGQRWCQRLYRGAVPSAGGMQRSRHSQGQHLSPAGQLESLAQSGDSRRKQRMKSRGHLPGFWESPVVGWQCQDSARAPHPPSLEKQDVGLSGGARELEQGLQAQGLETSLHHGLGLLDPHIEICMAQHSVAQCHGTAWCGMAQAHVCPCKAASAMESVTGPVRVKPAPSQHQLEVRIYS